MEKQVSEFIWQVAAVILLMGGITLFFVIHQMSTNLDQAVMDKVGNSRGIYIEETGGGILSLKGYMVYGQILEGHEIPLVIEGHYVAVGDELDHKVVNMMASYRPSYEIDGTGTVGHIRYERIN